MTISHVDAFMSALADAGLTMHKPAIIGDGALNRYRVACAFPTPLICAPGKPGKPGTPVLMRVSGFPVSKNGPLKNRETGKIRAAVLPCLPPTYGEVA